MEKALTPIQSIRAKCIDCSTGSLVEVRLCTVRTCPIWGYRMGKRPKPSDVPHAMESVKQITTGQRERKHEYCS